MRIYNKILSMAPLRIQISLNGSKLTLAGFPSVRLPAFLAFKLIRDVLTALSISLRVSFRVLEFKDVYDYAISLSVAGQFKRKHKDIGKNPFTQQQKEIVEQSIQKLNRLLKDCQKESLPLSKYGIFDESEHQNI